MSLRKNEDLQLTREKKDGGAFTKGIFTAGAGNVVDVEANVQPLTGSAYAQLSEGDRTRQPLLIISGDQILKDDRFTRDELDYEVVKVKDWSKSSLNPHYEAIALLKGN